MPSSSVRRSQSCFAAVEASTKLPLLNGAEQAGSQRPESVSLAVGGVGRKQRGSSSQPPPGGKASRAVPDKLPAISGAVPDKLPAIGNGLRGLQGNMPPSPAKAGSRAGGYAGAAKTGQARPSSGGRPPRGPSTESPPGASAAPRKRAGSNGYSTDAAVSSKAPPVAKPSGVKTEDEQQRLSRPHGAEKPPTGPRAASGGRSTPRAVVLARERALKEKRDSADEDKSPVKEAGVPKAPSAAVRDNGLRDCVSKDLREVMDEEVVTYSWRRKGAVQKEEKPVPTAQEEEKPVPTATPTAPSTTPSPALPTETDEAAQAVPKAPSAKAPKGKANNAGYGGSNERPGRGVRFSSQADDVKPVVDAGSKQLALRGPRPSGIGGGSKSSDSSAGRIDLEQVKRGLQGDVKMVKPAVQLLSYDGSSPKLEAGPMSSGSAAPPVWLVHWLNGAYSGDLASLYADHWLQGQVAWPDAGEGQRCLSIAGMLADVSFQRVALVVLRIEIFELEPHEAASASVAKVLQKAGREEDGTAQQLLVSEAEVALNRLEAEALGQALDQQAGARLVAAVRRELLRLVWCPDFGSSSKDEGGGIIFDDSWLRDQLSRSPQEADSSFKKLTAEELMRENSFLDNYLVRLLRVKRSLIALLDEWEKVDHYAILGVPPTASDKELKTAYRKACLLLHPDKGGDKSQFQQLQDSYARILEQRAKAKKEGSGDPVRTAGQADKTPSAAAGSSCPPAAAGDQLALEAPSGTPSNPCDGTEEAQEVVASAERLRSCAEATQKAIREAEKADAVLRELRKPNAPGGVDSLTAAQQAGETLMTLSQQVGEAAPELGEASMEVAECSLSLSARFSSVPTALLLTDVALSCTLEASRIQHTGKQLLEVRRDTISTLQTLNANLSMAKIIGTVDAETMKLSLGLVCRAATRIMASLRQAAAAVTDALQRGHQCTVHAQAVCRFAAGRSAADAEAAEDLPAAALPAPDGFEPAPPTPDASSRTGKAAEGDSHAPKQESSRTGGGSDARTSAHPEDPTRRAVAAALQARRQNDQLLRQLNSELLDLQRRAKPNLAKKPGLMTEEITHAAAMVAEVLLFAREAMLAAFVPEVARLEDSLSEHLGFVEACGSDILAAPVDLRAQLLRAVALFDSQAVLHALEQQVKPSLVARCVAVETEELRASLLLVLERRFELLATSVVNVRL